MSPQMTKRGIWQNRQVLTEGVCTQKSRAPSFSENARLWRFMRLLHGVVAIGVVLLPVPAVGTHLLDAVLRFPAKLFSCL